jgi:predicted Rossmann fold nucleotide-binding protein DprA/Smf involved in DNA uptake
MANRSATPRARLALALEHVEGLGRVGAGRLVPRFERFEAMLATPREQVLTRLKRIPNAARTVDRLFDAAYMSPHLDAADREVESLAKAGVLPLASGDPEWPAGVNDLPAAERPHILFVFGSLAALAAPRAALLGAAAMGAEAFERAQDLTRHLTERGVRPVVGASHGFDVVVAKLSHRPDSPAPAVLVAACGLAHLSGPLRPVASAVVRAGGTLVSAFPMGQPYYPHQDDDAALLMAALAPAGVFVAPKPDTPAWKALAWTQTSRRAAFALAPPDDALPEALHRLVDAVDMEWVVAAAGLASTPRP